jgi:hypothetical protein
MSYSYLHNIVWYADPDVMILRAPLSLEQARVWATVQGLTGQALMASDRLMDLGPQRVEIMRRVYPAVDIRPLDLYPAGRNKQIWDLKISHLGRQYDVVGVFNFGQTGSEQVLLRWQDLGLPDDRPVHAFDFWNAEYLGAWEAGIAVDVAPTSCRVLTLLPADQRPQWISTNRHITQGWIDLKAIDYNDSTLTFCGTSQVIKEDPYELRFVFPRGRNLSVKRASAEGLAVWWTNHQGWATVTIKSDRTTEVKWNVEFQPADIYQYPPEAPSNVRVKAIGLDSVEVTWSEVYWLNAGYRVYLDQRLVGYTPRAAMTVRQLDPKTTYHVSIETVWEDGSASRRRAQTSFTIADMLPGRIRLSQLQGQRAGALGRGLEFDGPITIGGRVYADPVILRPGSSVSYRLNGLFTRLQAKVAVQAAGTQTGLRFRVSGDGRQIWEGGPLGPDDEPRHVDVAIEGVERLVLEVVSGASGPAGPRSGRASGAWLDAELIR